MSSYWNSIVRINGKAEKHLTSPKYTKVATQMTPIKQNKIKPAFLKSHKSEHSLNNRSSTNTNAVSEHNDSDSELDDDDFPDATDEHHSLINLNTKISKSNVRHPWANKELSWWNHFSIGAYWFGWAFLWMPLLVIVIPHQVEYIVDGQDAAKSMGSVFLFGSIGSLICCPVFGHLSDNSQNAMGRRRPFLMVGICVTTMGLLLMSVSPPYHIYCVGFFICSCGNFITLAPYSALVPDVVPYDQRGICSGWLGACSMFGYLCGGFVCYHIEKLGFFLTFIFLAMVHAVFGWITLRFVPEIHITAVSHHHSALNASNTEDLDLEDNQLELAHELSSITNHPITSINTIQMTMPRSTTSNHNTVDDRDPQFKNRNVQSQYRTTLGFTESFPFCNSDFVWLFISRFFIQMGAIIVQENLQYYLRDTKGGDFSLFGVTLAKDEVQAVAVLFAPLLFGALVSSIVSGFLSDIYGQQRKFLVYFSGISMSACCLLFGMNSFFIFDIVISLFFGFGFGIFSAIDWAMATDVLPNPNSYGRDMGFWNLSMTLPQIIGSPIVGYLIDIFRKMEYVRLGWLSIFTFSAINFMLGTVLVKKIAHVK